VSEESFITNCVADFEICLLIEQEEM
jgi:hypothetical protein